MIFWNFYFWKIITNDKWRWFEYEINIFLKKKLENILKDIFGIAFDNKCKLFEINIYNFFFIFHFIFFLKNRFFGQLSKIRIP